MRLKQNVHSRAVLVLIIMDPLIVAEMSWDAFGQLLMTTIVHCREVISPDECPEVGILADRLHCKAALYLLDNDSNAPSFVTCSLC